MGNADAFGRVGFAWHDYFFMPRGTVKGSAVWWATRDSDTEGVLGHIVDLWTERPTRYTNDLGGFWMVEEKGIAARYGQYDIDTIYKWARITVDTDRECIKVERGYIAKT